MSKEKVTHNRIAPKQKTQEGDKHWNFKAPSYDNRDSCSVTAGDTYGIGFKQPVGSKNVSPYQSGPIPIGAFHFEADKVIEDQNIKG